LKYIIFSSLFLILLLLGTVPTSINPPILAVEDLSTQATISNTYTVTTNYVKYNIPYTITNGVIQDISPPCDDASVIVQIMQSSSGTITLEIPRSLLDAKFSNGCSKD